MILSPEDLTPDRLVVIHSLQQGLLGQSYALTGATALTVGRGTQSTILLDGDSVSRHHARLEKRGDEWWVVDCGSTNGTYVNDRPVTGVRLIEGDIIKIGSTLLKVTAPFIQETHHQTTLFDGLTGAYNRRFLHEWLDAELGRRDAGAARPLSLVMVDLDHFKRLNDVHGHRVGDEVLVQLAAILQIYAAPGGFAARHGGEEFALLLPGVDAPEAAGRAELLRAEVAAHTFVFGEDAVALTLSAGVAQADDATRTARDLIERADRRLYDAKRAGRDRVIA